MRSAFTHSLRGDRVAQRLLFGGAIAGNYANHTQKAREVAASRACRCLQRHHSCEVGVVCEKQELAHSRTDPLAPPQHNTQHTSPPACNCGYRLTISSKCEEPTTACGPQEDDGSFGALMNVSGWEPPLEGPDCAEDGCVMVTYTADSKKIEDL